jgi:uncharacterized membrane protein
MNSGRSDPPKSALWLLRRLCPKRNREAITGDLLERFGEGRSTGWFWRQVLVAILVGASSQFRLLWTEICFAAAGTVLIWCIPWGRIFPIAAMTNPSMNWSARFLWFIAIEITTALIVLPLFAVLFRQRRTFGWANMRQVFFVSGMLFAVGDLPAIWWDVSHPISRLHGAWVVPMMVAWIYAALLISARIARQLPSPPNTITT